MTRQPAQKCNSHGLVFGLMYWFAWHVYGLFLDGFVGLRLSMIQLRLPRVRSTAGSRLVQAIVFVASVGVRNLDRLQSRGIVRRHMVAGELHVADPLPHVLLAPPELVVETPAALGGRASGGLRQTSCRFHSCSR
eukprot:3313009-Rhodomonas_salina.2